jgi:hypothetical protein
MLPLSEGEADCRTDTERSTADDNDAHFVRWCS